MISLIFKHFVFNFLNHLIFNETILNTILRKKQYFLTLWGVGGRSKSPSVNKKKWWIKLMNSFYVPDQQGIYYIQSNLETLSFLFRLKILLLLDIYVFVEVLIFLVVARKRGGWNIEYRHK